MSSDIAAPSANLTVQRLSASDIPDAMALSREAGWNQVEVDWGVFIEHGRTVGIRVPGDGLVATAAGLPYEAHFGVVAMVLVTPRWRRRGIASRLVSGCIEELGGRGLVAMLDATPAGAAVYGGLGFRPLFGFDRWELDGRKRAAIAATDGASADADTLVQLDAEANGARRAFLLEDVLQREGSHVLCSQDRTGFALVRDGRIARQIGPVVARDEAAALGLVANAVASCAGRVFIDVPSVWRRIGGWLAEGGGRIQRSFTRMALGRSAPFGDPDRLFAVAGPEFG